jgi:hypothetical protein
MALNAHADRFGKSGNTGSSRRMVKTSRLTHLGHHWEHSTAYRDGAVCWAWVANLILLHNFKVFALKIKRGTLALLDQQ